MLSVGRKTDGFDKGGLSSYNGKLLFYAVSGFARRPYVGGDGAL
jgi:hypothetical protein